MGNLSREWERNWEIQRLPVLQVSKGEVFCSLATYPTHTYCNYEYLSYVLDKFTENQFNICWVINYWIIDVIDT